MKIKNKGTRIRVTPFRGEIYEIYRLPDTLEGETGVIIDYDKVYGLYQVKLDSGTTIMINPLCATAEDK